MDMIEQVAERKIRKAMETGAFDNLPNKGKPLVIEDDSRIPEDLRIAYKILKNAGFLPPELELRREMINLEELIRCCEDEAERASHRHKLSVARLRFEMAMQKHGKRFPAAYEARIYERFQ